MGLRASTQINNDSVYVQLDGTLAMQASLDLGSFTIINVATPVNGTDAANKNYVDQELGYYVLKGGDTMTGNLDMQGNKVVDLGVPSANSDAATKQYVDNEVGTRVSTSGDTMTGPLSMSGSGIDMGSNKITSLADPTFAQDAATKNYVDGARQGLDYKENCRVSPDSSVSFTPAGGAPDTVDGVPLSVDDRVLLTTHTTASTNGIYIVEAVGTGSNGSWSRAADANEDSEVTAGLTVWVAEGNARADTAWALTTDDPITVGTTGLDFVQISGLGQITAGDGILKSGDTIHVNWGNGLNVNGSNVLEIDTPVSPLQLDADRSYRIGMVPGQSGQILVGQWNGSLTPADQPVWKDMAGDAYIIATGALTVNTPGVAGDTQTIKSTGSGVQVADGPAGELLIAQGDGIDTAFKPISGDATLAADGTLTVTSGLNSSDLVHHESLVSQVGDGTPAAFTTANNFVSNTEKVFLNGAQLEKGNEYTVTASNEITISAGLVPVSGDRIWIHYQKA